MVSQQRLQAGIAKYIDQEFTSKIEGWKRWGVGIGSALILESLPVTLQRWQASELGAMLGIFGDGGDIDIEAERSRLLLALKDGADNLAAIALGLGKVGIARVVQKRESYRWATVETALDGGTHSARVEDVDRRVGAVVNA